MDKKTVMHRVDPHIVGVLQQEVYSAQQQNNTELSFDEPTEYSVTVGTSKHNFVDQVKFIDLYVYLGEVYNTYQNTRIIPSNHELTDDCLYEDQWNGVRVQDDEIIDRQPPSAIVKKPKFEYCFIKECVLTNKAGDVLESFTDDKLQLLVHMSTVLIHDNMIHYRFDTATCFPSLKQYCASHKTQPFKLTFVFSPIKSLFDNVCSKEYQLRLDDTFVETKHTNSSLFSVLNYNTLSCSKLRSAVTEAIQPSKTELDMIDGVLDKHTTKLILFAKSTEPRRITVNLKIKFETIATDLQRDVQIIPKKSIYLINIDFVNAKQRTVTFENLDKTDSVYQI